MLQYSIVLKVSQVLKPDCMSETVFEIRYMRKLLFPVIDDVICSVGGEKRCTEMNLT
jgi:hypothetical protein